MKFERIALLWLLTLAVVGKSTAQYSRYAAVNAKYVDSVRQVFDSLICSRGLVYPKEHDTNEIAQIRSVIRTVNFFLNNDVSEERIDSVMGKLPFAEIRKSRVKNGLLHVITLAVVTPVLYSELTFEFAGKYLVARNFLLRPPERVRCGRDGFAYIDFRLLDTLYARQIDYPMTLMYWRDIQLTKLDRKNLAGAAHAYPEYRWGTEYFDHASGEDWVGGFLRNQYDPDNSGYYSHKIADINFARLIKEGKIVLIRDLLFSPNYFYAINAMEAMIYLSQTGRLTISPLEKERMELLKNDDSLIIIKNSDVIYHHNGYGELDKVTVEEIVGKYKRALD